MNKQLTVGIYFTNGKQTVITNVDTLTYDTEFINNKWQMKLDIARNIDSRPEYFSYKNSEVDMVVIDDKLNTM